MFRKRGGLALGHLFSKRPRPIDELGLLDLLALLGTIVVESNGGFLQVQNRLLGEVLDVSVPIGGDAEGLGGEDAFAQLGELLFRGKRDINTEGIFALG